MLCCGGGCCCIVVVVLLVVVAAVAAAVVVVVVVVIVFLLVFVVAVGVDVVLGGFDAGLIIFFDPLAASVLQSNLCCDVTHVFRGPERVCWRRFPSSWHRCGLLSPFGAVRAERMRRRVGGCSTG